MDSMHEEFCDLTCFIGAKETELEMVVGTRQKVNREPLKGFKRREIGLGDPLRRTSVTRYEYLTGLTPETSGRDE